MQCHFDPKLADFLANVFRVELAWHTIGIIQLCQVLCNGVIITKLQIHLSSLN